MYTPMLAGLSVWSGLLIICMYHATFHFVRLFFSLLYYAYVRIIYTLVSYACILGLCIPYWHVAYILGLFIPCFFLVHGL